MKVITIDQPTPKPKVYAVTVLAHYKKSGKCIDGSDYVYSKGIATIIEVTVPENAKLKDDQLFVLAKRKTSLLVTKLIKVELKGESRELRTY